MEDSKIIELLFERDEKALKEAKVKYGRLCLRICSNILERKEDAEECVSDTFLKLWNSVPPIKPNNLSLYLCKRLNMPFTAKYANVPVIPPTIKPANTSVV